ncbi:hypothetical protein ACSMXM_14270 [Pacificimonas sp. ICDLI1SI03]
MTSSTDRLILSVSKIEQQGGGSCARYSWFFSASASIELGSV